MPGPLTATVDWRLGFFTEQRVIDALDRAKRRNMSKWGAFLRQRSRSLTKKPGGKAGRVSAPGEPPRRHTGLLRDRLYFGYDFAKDTVVVGPAKTNQVFFDGDGRPVTGTVPEVLEYGGSVRVLEVFKWGKWRRADLRSRRRNAGLPTRLRRVNVAARPYMRRALKEELAAGKLPDVWRDSVRRAA